jgi:type V secretory pathway adhesin AidA
LAGAALVGVLATGANAATIHEVFHLGGHAGVASSHEYTSGDLTMTVTAFQHNKGDLKSQIQVGQWSAGLGAQFKGDKDHRVDGRGRDEMLLFSFNREVTLKFVGVSYFDHDDDVEIASYFMGKKGLTLDEYHSDVDLDPWFKSTWFYNGSSDDHGQVWLDADEQVTSKFIGIGADHKDDQFKVAAIKVSYEHIAAIPLPAGLPLLLGGFGLLAVLRKRKSA